MWMWGWPSKIDSLATKGEKTPWALSHGTDGPWVILLFEPKSSKNNYGMEIPLLNFFLVIKKCRFIAKKPLRMYKKMYSKFTVPSPFYSLIKKSGLKNLSTRIIWEYRLITKKAIQNMPPSLPCSSLPLTKTKAWHWFAMCFQSLFLYILHTQDGSIYRYIVLHSGMVFFKALIVLHSIINLLPWIWKPSKLLPHHFSQVSAQLLLPQWSLPWLPIWINTSLSFQFPPLLYFSP